MALPKLLPSGAIERIPRPQPWPQGRGNSGPVDMDELMKGVAEANYAGSQEEPTLTQEAIAVS